MNNTSFDNSLDKEKGAVENTPENVTQDELGLIKFLCGSLTVLWKDWPRDMKATLLDAAHNKFSLVGVCPHCRNNSVFMQVTSTHTDTLGGHHWMYQVGMQCQGCLKYILGIVKRDTNDWRYQEHYPLGRPDDFVHEKVPEAIAEDFAEAKRCLWIRAFRASVAMCRRAVQSSCDDLGAQGKDLYKQIDDLAQKGIITEPLRQLAHKVRLVANAQLHAKHDDLGTIIEKDAEAIIAFTQEYFHHVYVMPALLKDYDQPTT